MERDPTGVVPAQRRLIDDLRGELREAHETLNAIRDGEVDAVLVRQSGFSKIFTLVNADRPYRFLIEQMKEGAVTLSEEGVVLYGNRRLGEIFDSPIEKVVGSSIRRFFSVHELEKFDALIGGAAGAPSRAEFLLQRPGKPAVPIYFSVNDIVSEPGGPRLIGGVVTDLTQQHAIKARFSQAQKMEAVGQLTGGLAHDFNNLLQTISGNLNQIRERPGDVVNVRKWADSGLKASSRGARLTAQLLAFSRTQEIDIAPVDMMSLVRGMSELLRRTLGAAVNISYELEPSRVFVLADKVQLELAILNMAINARDAMPRGGQLRVSTQLCDMENDPDLPAGAYLELSVTDTGSGMAEGIRTRAFDPFFTTKDLSEGSGLGLAQVYGIARQAGGVARISSAVGIGTKVTLLLRQSAPPPASEGADGHLPVQPVAVAAAAKILVVDDDDDIRVLLVEGLSWLGYTVSEASSGQAALDLMAVDPPDLLVSDYMMPGMSGAEMVKRGRAAGLLMPVIFATGYAKTEALNDALGFKATVLIKPFSMEELAAAIEIKLAKARTLA